ncbi:MAG: hypothetical protein JKY76_05545 [Proteobacteria bacterium]|nr:hypothetical protein [Pseudomonadota bacterium]
MNTTDSQVVLTHEEYTALTDRIKHFEHINRRDLDALNMLLEMNSLFSTNANNRERHLVFSSLKEYISRLINVELIAFFQSDNEDSSFSLVDYSNTHEIDTIIELEKIVVNNGEFAWALSQNRAVIVDHTDPDKIILLHVLSTKARVRGMFMGVIAKENVPSSSCMNLLSTFFQSAAYSLESIALYSMVNTHNRELENIVEQRTQSLKVAIATAEQANHAKSQFLTSMSHELRTPLSSIMGFTQLLASDPDSPPTPHQAECLEYVLQGGQHLLDLINQLLDQAKIEAGKLDLHIKSIDIEAVFDECITLVRSLAEKQKVSLHIPKGVSHIIQADHLRLKQVLLNLLSNGIKYNKPNGSITLRCDLQGSMLKVSVIDTGVGISVKHQKRLFTSFSRLSQESSAIEGYGIGLVISKTLIEAMHGNLGFNSVEGQGTTFWFELPIIQHTS